MKEIPDIEKEISKLLEEEIEYQDGTDDSYLNGYSNALIDVINILKEK